MATADITRLMNNLRVQLPGAIDGVIQLEIYNAMNEFFQDSNVWREDIDVPVVPNTLNYTIVPTATASIVRLIGVVDNYERPVGAVLDLLNDNELALFNSPSEAATYTAQVSLTVNEPLDNEGFPTFPAWVLNLYMGDFISGVLSRMLAQPAKPYTNAQLATYHGTAFRGAISKARSEANRRYTYRNQVWRFPRGWSRNKAARG